MLLLIKDSNLHLVDGQSLCKMEELPMHVLLLCVRSVCRVKPICVCVQCVCRVSLAIILECPLN